MEDIKQPEKNDISLYILIYNVCIFSYVCFVNI